VWRQEAEPCTASHSWYLLLHNLLHIVHSHALHQVVTLATLYIVLRFSVTSRSQVLLCSWTSNTLYYTSGSTAVLHSDPLPVYGPHCYSTTVPLANTAINTIVCIKSAFSSSLISPTCYDSALQGSVVWTICSFLMDIRVMC